MTNTSNDSSTTTENSLSNISNIVLGIESLPGLLEVEHIGFNCLYGSEHMKVESHDFYGLLRYSFSVPNFRNYKTPVGDPTLQNSKKIKNEIETSVTLHVNPF